MTVALARSVALLLSVLVLTDGPARAAPAEWTAKWIASPGTHGDAAGVFHFRKSIRVDAEPERLIVRVSADNRYVLFANGVEVSRGPARGDLMHWRYESVDLAPYLHSGTNVIGATVWNWGEYRPGAQISRRTGFLLQSVDPAYSAIDTSAAWKVARDEAYVFTPVAAADVGGYYAASPGEAIDARNVPWGWDREGYDASRWRGAVPIGGPAARGTNPYGEAGDWQLVPRNIPSAEQHPIRFARVRRSKNVKVPRAFLAGDHPLTIPANSNVSILIDQGYETMGYPVLVASGGRDAKASVTFAESLVDAHGQKGNRDEIAGKTIRGLSDRIIFDGGEHRRFEPLWLRTWRYVQLDVKTAAQPLRIDDLHSIFTAYPFQQRAAFSSDQLWIGRVWDIDWRVFRLSAFETFWDTPYYEQFQYVGDSRIESLLSLYDTGDDRLMRNAIEQFDQSRIPDGLTASRYPSSLPQYIPPFSLWWVAMVHDHWLYRGDAGYSRQFLPGVRSVIGWYEGHVDRIGLLGPMPWWNFLDWSPTFDRGVAPGAENGHSTAISLQFAYVLRLAANLERSLGSPAEADHDLALSDRLNAAARAQSWDASRGLFADTPDKRSFSQQTNSLAILSGAVVQKDGPAVMRHILTDKDLVQASYYFRFYVDEALYQSGLADEYLQQLGPWREMLRLGLTTTLEQPEPSRSDSHAWSAHPNYHLLTAVLGIRPAEPGFRSTFVAPALGELKRASGRVPTPLGEIAVQFRRRSKSGVSGWVDLPLQMNGTFVWNGRQSALKPGRNVVRR